MSDPLTIIHGDAFSSLRRLPDESVQCCVTSPPYWSLRDYGVDALVWDGAEDCDHQWGDTIAVNATNHTDKRRWNHTRNGRDEEQPVEKRVAWLRTVVDQGNVCERCGAWRGCLGLEPTPELYVQHVMDVFREAKRVLRSDGTLWLNLGDSYAGGGNGGGGSFAKDGIRCALPGTDKNKAMRYGSCGVTVKSKRMERGSGRWGGGNAPATGDLKPKDLVGIPWMVAFALRADGWYLRSDIIWSKSNPMPESVSDRPTRAHEYIFLLSKSQRYFYDHEAIKEPAVADRGNGHKRDARLTYDGRGSDKPYISARDAFRRENSKRGQAQFGQTVGTHRPDRKDTIPTDTRNKRSVWEIATKPFPEAHFATFPTELVQPCILAGAPVGGVVVDPFAGSGTTGKVAVELGRKAILIEPKAEYVEMIKRRCQTTIGLPITA